MMMIPRVHPTYTFADLRTALLPARDAVARFESALAAYFGMNYALVFPYGRSAIHAALCALGGRGEVVQPAYNCAVVAHATVLSEHHPLFVDCQSDSPNQDSDAMIDAVNAQTVAVIPTSIFGMTFDAPSLIAAIRSKNPRTFVLMDCAQSFDVRWQGNLVAAQSDAAILAFGIGKAMTALFGGALLTNRKDIARTVQNYRDHSFRSPSIAHLIGRLAYFVASWFAVSRFGVKAADFVERSGALNAFRSRESIRLPNDNSVLMPRCQAAIGNAQLSRLPAFIKRRKEISAIYERALSDACGVRLPAWHEGATHTIYTLRLDDPSRRADVLDQLRRRGVQGGTVLDYVVPDLECYRERGNAGDFPNARAWARRALNLPNHPTLSDAQVEQCASALRRALAASQSR